MVIHKAPFAVSLSVASVTVCDGGCKLSRRNEKRNILYKETSCAKKHPVQRNILYKETPCAKKHPVQRNILCKEKSCTKNILCK
jgi:hypothetical protein